MRSASRPIIIIVLLLMFSVVNTAIAQDENAIPVHFAGRIQSVGNGAIIVINQITIDTSGAVVNASLQVGNVIVVNGLLREDGIIAAQTLSIYGSPQVVTPPLILPTLQPVENVAVSGEIEAIDRNMLTIDGQVVIVPADNPALTGLQVGDRVDIAGQQVGGYTVAVTVTKVETTPTDIVIEGSVQAINGNIVTINDLNIQFAADNPLLPHLQIGDVVRIEGRYVESANGLVFQIAAAILSSPSGR